MQGVAEAHTKARPPARFQMRDIVDYAKRYASTDTNGRRPEMKYQEVGWICISWPDANAGLTVWLEIHEGRFSYGLSFPEAELAVDARTMGARAELMRRAVVLGTLVQRRFYPESIPS